MNRKHQRISGSVAAILAVALTALGLAAGASAHEGEFAKFDQCPSTTTGVFKCIYSVTEGGEVILGKKAVPIVNPVTLQGGYSEANAENVATFFGATNGETLSKSPQPVPGGLLGLLNCKEQTDPTIKALCEVALENGLTGVNSTLELARPAGEIQISERNLVLRKGTALQMPVKVHLENPLLGSSCEVGSSSEPIIWNLTTGKTSPPPPNEPIEGILGAFKAREGGLILHVSGNQMVDNAWSAPGAEGCGGPLSALIDPVIDSQTGLPAAAGENTAILQNTIDLTTASAVNEH
jgi:hypothetical protein